jgi:hypothetical protein
LALPSPRLRATAWFAALAAGVIALALLAAWQIPPRMDWNRYRGAIANFASARMGRQVSIDGQVRLLLLPDTVLVADKVRLADRGDGISATIGALRLRIALAPLLQGRLVPRRLELDDPTIRLPWPLPRGAAQVPSGVAGGFSASVEGGALHVGRVVLAGITAGVQTDPDTGAFAAQGSARLGRFPCNFMAIVGAPGADGVSSLSVTLDGRAGVQGAGGNLRGRVTPGGVVRGDLALRGPDLSRLMPAPALAWRVQGKVEAGAAQIAAPHVSFELGGSTGEGSATLALGNKPGLDVSAAIGQLTPDGWGWTDLPPAPWLAARLDLAVAASSVMGGTVRDVHLLLALDDARATVQAQGTLPGATPGRLSLEVHPAAGGTATTDGHFSLKSADGPALAAWLAPLAPRLRAALPDVPAQADASGAVGLAGGRVVLSGVVLHAGGSTLTGSVSVPASGQGTLDAAVAIDRLEWPGALPSGWWAALRGLPDAGARFAALDAAFDLSVSSLRIGGATVSHLQAQGRSGAGGLAVTHASADLPGAHVEASGGIGADGSLAETRFDLAAADAGALKLPLRLPAGLWTGPVHVALTAAGPPQAIVGQLRGDLGDLRAEAEASLNARAPLVTATVTLRHPGAPRLLGQLGLGTSGAWLGQGSVAFSAHLTAAPGQVAVNDFSLGAGALRLSGQAGADFSGAEPLLSGRLDAPVLPLPGLAVPPDSMLPLALLHGWQGQFVLSARQIMAGLAPLATGAAGTLTVADGGVLLDGAAADIAGGHFAGVAAADVTLALPVFALHFTLARAATSGLPAMPGLAWRGGALDIGGQVGAAGNSPAALLATLAGRVQGRADGIFWQGIDLAALTRLLAARGPRLRGGLQAALAGGESGPLEGGFEAAIDNGGLSISHAAFAGAAGRIDAAGGIDLPAHVPDLVLHVAPAVPRPPVLTVREAGSRRVVNVQPGLAWAGRAKPERQPGAAGSTARRRE